MNDKPGSLDIPLGARLGRLFFIAIILVAAVFVIAVAMSH
jgi:hypothetical protein